jgi:hypothetical protein
MRLGLGFVVTGQATRFQDRKHFLFEIDWISATKRLDRNGGRFRLRLIGAGCTV